MKSKAKLKLYLVDEYKLLDGVQFSSELCIGDYQSVKILSKEELKEYFRGNRYSTPDCYSIVEYGEFYTGFIKISTEKLLSTIPQDGDIPYYDCGDGTREYVWTDSKLRLTRKVKVDDGYIIDFKTYLYPDDSTIVERNHSVIGCASLSDIERIEARISTFTRTSYTNKGINRKEITFTKQCPIFKKIEFQTTEAFSMVGKTLLLDGGSKVFVKFLGNSVWLKEHYSNP